MMAHYKASIYWDKIGTVSKALEFMVQVCEFGSAQKKCVFFFIILGHETECTLYHYTQV